MTTFKFTTGHLLPSSGLTPFTARCGKRMSLDDGDFWAVGPNSDPTKVCDACVDRLETDQMVQALYRQQGKEQP